MGEDYVFQSTYRLDSAIRFKTVEGLQGYGPMDMYVISGLKPFTKYYVDVRIYCGRNSNYKSRWISTTFTTLKKGKHF